MLCIVFLLEFINIKILFL